MTDLEYSYPSPIEPLSLSEELKRREVNNFLREKYNPDGSDVRNYQLQLLKALKAFDEFCRNHEIKYMLAYGTLLGAARHQAFVPWDDDADIWMDRSNFDKLCSLMNGPHHLLKENLGVVFGTRPTIWYHPYSLIDIFVLDDCPNNKFLRSVKQHAAEMINMIIKAKSRLNRRCFKNPKIWFVFMPIAILLPLGKWYKLLRRVSMWFSKSSKCDSYGVYNECVSQIWRTYSKEYFKKINTLEFEGCLFPVPSEYDAILRCRYGNYLKLPKELHTHDYASHFSNTEK